MIGSSAGSGGAVGSRIGWHTSMLDAPTPVHSAVPPQSSTVAEQVGVQARVASTAMHADAVGQSALVVQERVASTSPPQPSVNTVASAATKERTRFME
jgi:hypothetical protein